VLGWIGRHWWRVVGLACLLAAVAFSFHGSEIDRRWDERMEHTEAKWQELAAKMHERAEALRKARGLAEQNRLAVEVIEVLTEQITLQKQDLWESQELYYERRECDTYIRLLNGAAAFVFAVGMLLERRAARRRARGTEPYNADPPAEDEHDPRR
jgi:hypothetical protein